MKLRFQNNSLRLRVNRHEAADLASGGALEERVSFPGDACIRYVLEVSAQSSPRASFADDTIRVTAPQHLVRDWAANDTIGIYFDLPVNGSQLKVAIEKDLECVDGPAEERDPDAFPRSPKNC
ncbi:MAG: DUF7009 family protein [Bryobacteraceae bacterium]